MYKMNDIEIFTNIIKDILNDNSQCTPLPQFNYLTFIKHLAMFCSDHVTIILSNLSKSINNP